MKVEIKDNSKAVIKKLEDNIRKALEEIGLLWLEKVDPLVPVDTGVLQSSMMYKVDVANKRVFVGTPIDYGIFQELGTVKMRAQPFLKPSLMNYIAVYKKAIQEMLGSGWDVYVGGMMTKSEHYQSDNRVTNI